LNSEIANLREQAKENVNYIYKNNFWKDEKESSEKDRSKLRGILEK